LQNPKDNISAIIINVIWLWKLDKL
jgi:hypothetical protein